LSAVETAQGTAFKLANLEVLINTVLYNPVLALHIMEGIHPGMARTFFDQWFVAINAENKLPRVHDKKLTIVTLCALMELSMERIPNCLRDGWFGILGCVIKMFKELPKAIQGRLSFFCSRLIGFELIWFFLVSEERVGAGYAGRGGYG